VYVEQLSAEARKVLVEAYVALRRGDALPGSQVAYRITVRQLEGLVRLVATFRLKYVPIDILSILIHLHNFFVCKFWRVDSSR
jgi:hypothetical protein